MNDSVYDLLYLISCAVNETVPDASYVGRMDSEALLRLANRHKVASMAAFALEGAKDALPPGQWARWLAVKENAVRRNLLFDAERERHLAWMEEKGIWYMPVKGILLKDMYPRYGMREMADNDILYDRSRADELCAYMAADGYDVKQFGRSVHDSYYKPPVFNFEFHNYLFNGTVNGGALEEYYLDVSERMIPTEGTRYGYHLSANDLYVYVTAHAFKHYDGSGTGFRTLADDYMFRKAEAAELDFAYIDGEFEKLEIGLFAKRLRALSGHLLAPYKCANAGAAAEREDKPERAIPDAAEPKPAAREAVRERIDALSPGERDVFGFMLSSGVYGTVEHRVEKDLLTVQGEAGEVTAETKRRYKLYRLFPSRAHMEKAVPFAEGRPWLLPAAYVYQILRAVFARRKALNCELEALDRIDSSREHSPL